MILDASSVVGIFGNFGQTNCDATKFDASAGKRLPAGHKVAMGGVVNGVTNKRPIIQCVHFIGVLCLWRMLDGHKQLCFFD
ncbi:hypothetical protein IWX87_002903 [Polaromonas sp. CG_9.7]|nr:hypothetical protein [Polaromonas sp. CG_9.7]MBG6115137.1 hypothetical protein [Polaromonas sp. CG_9.2]MDH6184965.1 hypothetical protein [Polaromonas sp. CG_23.6]